MQDDYMDESFKNQQKHQKIYSTIQKIKNMDCTMITDYNRSSSESDDLDDSISYKIKHQVSKKTKMDLKSRDVANKLKR